MRCFGKINLWFRVEARRLIERYEMTWTLKEDSGNGKKKKGGTDVRDTVKEDCS